MFLMSSQFTETSWSHSLQRGDLLFLTNYEEEDIRVGEIVVFKIDGRDIPIVHRCLVFNSCEDCLHFLLQGFETAREGGWVHQVPDQGWRQWFPCTALSLKHQPQGDNNSVDDRGLYAPGQLWLDRKVSCSFTNAYFDNCLILRMLLVVLGASSPMWELSRSSWTTTPSSSTPCSRVSASMCSYIGSSSSLPGCVTPRTPPYMTKDQDFCEELVNIHQTKLWPMKNGTLVIKVSNGPLLGGYCGRVRG